MSSNEAAERLLSETWAPNTGEVHGLVKQALAAERRATVARIRREVMAQPLRGGTDIPWTAIDAILDGEAAR